MSSKIAVNDMVYLHSVAKDEALQYVDRLIQEYHREYFSTNEARRHVTDAVCDFSRPWTITTIKSDGGTVQIERQIPLLSTNPNGSTPMLRARLTVPTFLILISPDKSLPKEKSMEKYTVKNIQIVSIEPRSV